MMPLYPSTSVVSNSIVSDLPRVNGSSGAKTYPTRPNTRDVVWDMNEDLFYVRVTDSNNVITSLDRFSFAAAPEPKLEDMFVSRNEFNELKGDIGDVKQSIRELLSIQQQSNRKPNTNKPNRPNSSDRANVQNSQSSAQPSADASANG